jgi:hypothetical protein
MMISSFCKLRNIPTRAITKAYLDILDRTFAGIAKMNTGFAVLAKAGAEMTSRSIENQEYSYQKAKETITGVSPEKMKELL